MIKGKRILTNAHVVADQSLVMVRKHGDPNKYIAEVAHVAHDGDLVRACVAVRTPSPIAVLLLPHPARLNMRARARAYARTHSFYIGLPSFQLDQCSIGVGNVRCLLNRANDANHLSTWARASFTE